MSVSSSAAYCFRFDAAAGLAALAFLPLRACDGVASADLRWRADASSESVAASRIFLDAVGELTSVLARLIAYAWGAAPA